MENIKEAIEFYKDHPYEFVIDIIGLNPVRIEKDEWCALTLEEKNAWQEKYKNDISWQQRDVLTILPIAIKENKGVAVKSGHGIGKTALESWIILWWMSTRPFPKIPCTAPTQHQLFDILWSELAKWHKKSINKDWFEWTKTHFYNKSDNENWFAVARSSKQPENMQGFHSDHLLFILDEASGIAQDIMEVIEGALTQVGCLQLMFGNPTKLSGGFFDAFNAKKDFFYTFTFSSDDTPMVNRSYVDKLISKYGKDSDVYRVRVLGLFPKAESDSMINFEKVVEATQRECEEVPYDTCEIGVDVARFGDDETIIAVRVGMIVHTLATIKGRDTMYTAGRVSEEVLKYQGSYAVTVNVDDTGVGGGVTDRLNQLMRDKVIKCKVVPVNNGERAFEPEEFVNKGSEMWNWLGKHIDEVSLPDDEELVNQLSTRRYAFDSKNRIMAERKENMKKRGLTSPDRGDAVVLCFHSLISEIDYSYDPVIA